MADVKTEQEPSIEEILESIRQIISEDADGQAKPAAATTIVQPQQKPAPQPTTMAPAAPAKPQQPTAPAAAAPLDLTEKIDPVPLDLKPQKPSPMTIELKDKPMTDEANSLLSAQTADAATESLSKLLAGNVAIERDEVGRPGKVTLEEMIREMIRPLIKNWLDQNLPALIEKLVQKEVEKLSRRAMDR